MFHQPTKTLITTNRKPPGDLIPVLSPEQLLAEGKRPALVAELKELSEFEASAFTQLCDTLLHQLANHTQRLPESTVYFGQLGGFLEHGLQRTLAAMTLFRQYLITNPNEAMSLAQKQWWYVLFSASLLRGIGRLCLDYDVGRYTLKGVWLKQWEPLIESVGFVNHYYDYEFKTHHDQHLRHRITLILARQLMPKQGFEWIASNPELLAMWLALLAEDELAGKALHVILSRADALVIQQELHALPMEHALPHEERRTRISTFVEPNATEPLLEKERLAALEFIRWLQEAIEQGRFILNKAPILAVPSGFIVSIDALKLFVREHAWYKNWQAIQQSVLALAISPADEPQISLATHEGHTGILIPGTILIPESIHAFDKRSNTIQATTVTALGLTEFPQRLSTAGVWAEAPLESVQISPNTQRPYG